MFSFFKNIFIWWHKQTFETFLYTLFTGKCVGKDEFGNKYYTNKKKKRWVIYNSRVESSKIPPQWHLWIHSATNAVPSKNLNQYKWQKPYEENLTGTNKAFKPEGSLKSKSRNKIKKYEAWKV